MVIRISTYVAATQAQAKRTLEAADKGRTERAAAPGRTTRPDASARGANLFGTPEEVVERIHELREDFGADEIMCTMLGHPLSREDVLQSIRLMADKVLPKVK